MTTPNLTFNLLTFTHPLESLTLWFSDQEQSGTNRLYHTLVPNEVKQHFGEQEHYYTSFDQETEGYFPVTKKTSPDTEEYTNTDGLTCTRSIKCSAFTKNILRRYYHAKINQHLETLDVMVKPNFVKDMEIWSPVNIKDNRFNHFNKFTLKIQFCRLTTKPELLISFDTTAKVCKQNVLDLMAQNVDTSAFNWITYNGKLFKYSKLSEEVRMELGKVFPVLNFDIRTALNLAAKAPDRSNKYIKFKQNTTQFIQTTINTESFKKIIPIDTSSFTRVPQNKIHNVTPKSNQLLFANGQSSIVPFAGLKNGPFSPCPNTNVQCFYIFPKGDLNSVKALHSYLHQGLHSFHGLYKTVRVPYQVQEKFSITFTNNEDPLPEIRQNLIAKSFEPGKVYFAIYISPHDKFTANTQNKNIYYQIKEELLKRNIASQTIDASKLKEGTENGARYDYSLNNIALAILAKLGGTPWCLDTPPENELIVGVGAFRHKDSSVQYIGNAFCFSNDGKLNNLECFRKDQTDELAGSILDKIVDYVAAHGNLNRLIIHFYKNMSRKEIQPIEDGLKELNLDIPVYIVTINKTESNYILAFDEESSELMPISGTYIVIGRSQYLLFNNVRYFKSSKMSSIDGYPFPIKLSIYCTKEEDRCNYAISDKLIDQVYQFSRLYYKSVRQQALPVTIKYPEMVAQIFPHFNGFEIPAFGKDKLWFL